jgi:hypothetical protein
VLAIVQHQQAASVEQVIDNRGGDLSAGRLRYAQRSGDPLRHQLRVLQRTELGPPDAVGEIGSRLARHPKRQPRLPAAPRTGEGDQPAMPDQSPDLAHGRLAPDQTRQLSRQTHAHHNPSLRNRFTLTGLCPFMAS